MDVHLHSAAHHALHRFGSRRAYHRVGSALPVLETDKRVILAKPAATDERTADTDTGLPIGDLYKEQFNDYLQRNFLGK